MGRSVPRRSHPLVNRRQLLAREGVVSSLTVVPQQRGFLRPGIQAGEGSVPRVEARASGSPVFNVLDTQVLMSSPASREDISARWEGREKEP